jgi:hypothetical protein
MKTTPGGLSGIANKPLPCLAMRTQIRAGVGAMPAFTEQMLGDDEVDAIVDYLNALQETPGPLCGTVGEARRSVRAQARGSCSLLRFSISRRTSSMSSARTLPMSSSSTGPGSAPACSKSRMPSRKIINVGMERI